MSDREDSSSTWRSGSCRVNGVDIHYRRSGGDKAPIIGLHGLIASGECLLPLVQSLEGAFDVVLPDARGHGRSSAPASGYLYSDLAEDVLGLITELKLDAPILLGHSMGGMTAAVVASALGAAAKAVVLVDPTFISPEWQREVFESDVAADHRQLLESTRDELLTQASIRSPDRPRELIEHLVDARLRTSLSAFQILTPPNPEWRNLVHQIRAPILLVVGDRGIVSPEIARELQCVNPSLRYEMISDAGHGIPYDEPAQVGAVMSDFLANFTGRESGRRPAI